MGYRKSFVAGQSGPADRADAERVVAEFQKIKDPYGRTYALSGGPVLAQAFAAAGVEPRGSLVRRDHDPAYSGCPTVEMRDHTSLNLWGDDDPIGCVAAALAGNGNGGRVVTTYY